MCKIFFFFFFFFFFFSFFPFWRTGVQKNKNDKVGIYGRYDDGWEDQTRCVVGGRGVTDTEGGRELVLYVCISVLAAASVPVVG